MQFLQLSLIKPFLHFSLVYSSFFFFIILAKRAKLSMDFTYSTIFFPNRQKSEQKFHFTRTSTLTSLIYFLYIYGWLIIISTVKTCFSTENCMLPLYPSNTFSTLSSPIPCCSPLFDKGTPFVLHLTLPEKLLDSCM